MHNKKRKFWGRTLALGLVASLGFVITSQAQSIIQSNAPGTAEDPLVTKSYVDEQINAALGGKAPSPSPSPSPSTPGTSSDEIIIVQMSKGETLMGGAGAEFVVRTGHTVAYSDSENGIADVTSGEDIASGLPIPRNHLLLFPREGRGIKADPNSNDEIYVMVRGAYLHLDVNGSPIAP